MDRSILLPDFMQIDPWIDYSDAIDMLFRDVDTKTRLLSRLREPRQLALSGQEKVMSGEMLYDIDFNQFDREYLVRSLNLIGLPFKDTSIFTDDHLTRLLRTLASYWFSKGRGTVAQYLSYVLNSDFSITNMWTQDYVTFYPEGDPILAGSKIYEGGPWYPTTHIQLTYDPTFQTGVSIQDVVQMVYDIGNYNLVMHSIVAEVKAPVVQESDNVLSIDDFIDSKSLALGHILVNELTISN